MPSAASIGAFVDAHTTGAAEVLAHAAGTTWDAIERESGVTRAGVEAFARLLIDRPKAVFVWSMGLTQHAHGVDTVKALVNLGLARGLPARPGSGLVPIRGHSGVQGGAEVGCVPAVPAETRARWAEVWGFDPPAQPGWTATEAITASAAGEVDTFWMVGGNVLETLPDTAEAGRALARPRLRIHQDIVLSTSMLVEGAGDVLLLPATTRYESPGGGTETSTERRIIFSPEIPGRRIGSAKPEWWVFREVMVRAFPERAHLVGLEDAAAIRREIDRAVPLYAGIAGLSRQGDVVQWGGPRLYADGRFATADGRARFAPVALRSRALPADRFFVSTRRGKQFNSMVQRAVDPLTGADRDEILISEPTSPASAARPATTSCSAPRRASSADGCAPRRSATATSKCTGRRATCCSPARRTIRNRSSRTTTPSSRSKPPAADAGAPGLPEPRASGTVQGVVEAGERDIAVRRLARDRNERRQMHAIEATQGVSFGKIASLPSYVCSHFDADELRPLAFERTLGGRKGARRQDPLPSTPRQGGARLGIRHHRRREGRGVGYQGANLIASGLLQEQFHEAAGIEIDRHRRSSSTMSEASFPGFCLTPCAGTFDFWPFQCTLPSATSRCSQS